MTRRLKTALAYAWLLLGAVPVSHAGNGQGKVTLQSLVSEMTDVAAPAKWRGDYKAAQVSSYDRRTVSPGLAGWFANNDGQGFERVDHIGGRTEKVLFDEAGPGAVTRIWMTTNDKRGILRFYIDGKEEPVLTIPAYDMSRFPVSLGNGFLMNHTHYDVAEHGVGGNTFYLPIPYARSCRITLEEHPEAPGAAHYYHIGYRTYAPGIEVESFSMEGLAAAKPFLEEADRAIMWPAPVSEGDVRVATLAPGGEMKLKKGARAVTGIEIELADTTGGYERAMEHTRLLLDFDGKRCVDCTLADFFSGGKGAPKVACYYFRSDGKGRMSCRWVMPYAREARLALDGDNVPHAKVKVTTVPFSRDDNTLYFHTSVNSERSIATGCDYDSNDNLDWNFASLSGRGVYCGDLLSLFNHCPDWYGEGDEKIWVDNDEFPSFMGTGTEDYYNCSWAPVVPFLTPYGGAPRADEASSHGWNAFLRVRTLDVIPFGESLRFDLEMLSWHPGEVDCNAVAFWYGDLATRPMCPGGVNE